MNRDALLQSLRVHIMRLRQQHQRQSGGVPLNCTVDELVGQVEGVLSTDKPDYGFSDALAQLQLIMNGGSTVTSPSIPPPQLPTLHRRGSIGSNGSLSEMIDAEAMVSRHSLKTLV